jgi:hypothetical protein
MFRTNYRPAPAKQTWFVGQSGIKVGFVRDLEVTDFVETPRDGRPNFYVLFQRATKRWYAFQPHLGLTRCDNLAEARAAFL